MRECLRHTDDFLQADTQGSRTPRLAAVAEDQQTAILECMKALQQSVLQQGQALQQLQQQQQALQMQSFAQLTPYMQPAAAAAPAAPVTAPAFGDKKTEHGCFLCGGPHMRSSSTSTRSSSSPSTRLSTRSDMGADPDNAAVGKLPGSSPVNVPIRHGPPRQKGSSSKRGRTKPTPGQSKVTDIE